jgi:hypothetical protein
VTRLVERGAVLLLAPLSIAITAVAVREATRTQDVDVVAGPQAREFVVPAAFRDAARSPGVDQRFRVDGERSRARFAAGDDGASRALRVTGSLLVLADESIGELTLELRSESGEIVVLRGERGASSVSKVPGARTGVITCDVSAGDASEPRTLDVAWLRLPGGVLRMHAGAHDVSGSMSLDLVWNLHP